ncbi:S-layer homology domain-containing protein, partial [bacterium]|nr:S-layer homology domain-containing protein [bacterium]
YFNSLRRMLFLLGAPGGSSSQDFRNLGILDPRQKKKSISRKQALEAAFRMTIHLEDSEFIALSGDEENCFTDYKPSSKYLRAFKFLKFNGIVNGYPDGKFRPSRALTNRESMYLLYHFYEHVSYKKAVRNNEKALAFVDIPIDHLIYPVLQKLQESGAFDMVFLGRSLDGDKPIKLSEIAGMISGILSKANKEEEIAKIHEVIREKNPEEVSIRENFAILVAELVKSLNVEVNESEKKITDYQDVSPWGIEKNALQTLANAGILLGYSKGVLHGKEIVTRYEALGVLDAVLEKIAIQPKVETEDLSVYPTKSDYRRYAKMLKAKKARCYEVLSKPYPYKRHE